MQRGRDLHKPRKLMKKTSCWRPREVCGKGMLRWLSRSLFWLRRFNIYAGAWQPRVLVRPLVQTPAIKLAEVPAFPCSSGHFLSNLPGYCTYWALWGLGWLPW